MEKEVIWFWPIFWNLQLYWNIFKIKVSIDFLALPKVLTNVPVILLWKKISQTLFKTYYCLGQRMAAQNHHWTIDSPSAPCMKIQRLNLWFCFFQGMFQDTHHIRQVSASSKKWCVCDNNISLKPPPTVHMYMYMHKYILYILYILVITSIYPPGQKCQISPAIHPSIPNPFAPVPLPNHPMRWDWPWVHPFLGAHWQPTDVSLQRHPAG